MKSGKTLIASSAFFDIGPKVLFEPIFGRGTSYQFIRAAQTTAERRARIATRGGGSYNIAKSISLVSFHN